MHGMSLAWVSCLFFLLSYPQFVARMGITLIFPALIPIVHHLRGYLAHFSCSHTHSSSLAWVSCLFSCSHTHNSSLAWVSRSFFLLSYPQFITRVGILLVFLLSYPQFITRVGILLVFISPYQTVSNRPCHFQQQCLLLSNALPALLLRQKRTHHTILPLH